ncbi:MAG TPA: hypothetical protein VFB94_16105 [Acidimicrobiales bacterium]|nr:hypothetical protein [Acidimicrobiales bacterium]
MSLGMTWAELASQGAEWDYSYRSLGLTGTLDDDIVADSPPGESVVSGFGAGANGGCS